MKRNKIKPFSIVERLRSFKYALHGIRIVITSQQNAWIHAVITILVCITGILLGINRSEWFWIILAIITVWTAEALNTAFEFLADVASPDFHPLVAKAKDVAAGAVLIAAIGSSIIGLLIFLPYLINLFK